MKLTEFYKNINEDHGERKKPNPKDYRHGIEDRNYIKDKELWIDRFGHEEKEELDFERKSEELAEKEKVTKEWEKGVRTEIERSGCEAAKKLDKQLSNKFRELGAMGEVAERALGFLKIKKDILYSIKDFVKCITSKDEPKPEVRPEKQPIKTQTTTTQDGTVVQTKTQDNEEIKTPVEQEREDYYEKVYEDPKVLPQPLYRSEDEVGDMGQVQSTELLDDLVINIENQILQQEPEIQEKLKEYNIDAEKISRLVPLTLETKNFMMKLDMEGIKLPFLMLLYENIDQLYPSIQNNSPLDVKKLKRLSKVINYNDFWDWTSTLWKKAPNYLKKNVVGSIPEFGDKFMVFP